MDKRTIFQRILSVFILVIIVLSDIQLTHAAFQTAAGNQPLNSIGRDDKFDSFYTFTNNEIKFGSDYETAWNEFTKEVGALETMLKNFNANNASDKGTLGVNHVLDSNKRMSTEDKPETQKYRDILALEAKVKAWANGTGSETVFGENENGTLNYDKLKLTVLDIEFQSLKVQVWGGIVLSYEILSLLGESDIAVDKEAAQKQALAIIKAVNEVSKTDNLTDTALLSAITDALSAEHFDTLTRWMDRQIIGSSPFVSGYLDDVEKKTIVTKAFDMIDLWSQNPWIDRNDVLEALVGSDPDMARYTMGVGDLYAYLFNEYKLAAENKTPNTIAKANLFVYNNTNAEIKSRRDIPEISTGYSQIILQNITNAEPKNHENVLQDLFNSLSSSQTPSIYFDANAPQGPRLVDRMFLTGLNERTDGVDIMDTYYKTLLTFLDMDNFKTIMKNRYGVDVPDVPLANSTGGTPTASAPTGSGSLSGYTIVVDAGHQQGGDVPGRVQRNPGTTQTTIASLGGTAGTDGSPEYEHTMNIALELESVLKARGANVVMTRKNNTDASNRDLDLIKRANMANDINADMYISLHYQGDQTSGYFSCVPKHSDTLGNPDAQVVAKSRELAGNVLDGYGAKVSIPPHPNPDFRFYETNNAEGFGYVQLSWSKVPAIIMELGSIGTSDLAYVQDAGNRKLMAEGLADGLAAFASNNPAKGGQTPAATNTNTTSTSSTSTTQTANSTSGGTPVTDEYKTAMTNWYTNDAPLSLYAIKKLDEVIEFYKKFGIEDKHSAAAANALKQFIDRLNNDLIACGLQPLTADSTIEETQELSEELQEVVDQYNILQDILTKEGDTYKLNALYMELFAWTSCFTPFQTNLYMEGENTRHLSAGARALYSKYSKYRQPLSMNVKENGVYTNLIMNGVEPLKYVTLEDFIKTSQVGDVFLFTNAVSQKDIEQGIIFTETTSVNVNISSNAPDTQGQQEVTVSNGSTDSNQQAADSQGTTAAPAANTTATANSGTMFTQTRQDLTSELSSSVRYFGPVYASSNYGNYTLNYEALSPENSAHTLISIGQAMANPELAGIIVTSSIKASSPDRSGNDSANSLMDNLRTGSDTQTPVVAETDTTDSQTEVPESVNIPSITEYSMSTLMTLQLTPDQLYLNYFAFHNVVEQEDHLQSGLKDDLNSLLFIDFLGNIVTESGYVVIPAAANATRYLDGGLYPMFNAMVLNAYPDVKVLSENSVTVLEHEQNKMLFYVEGDLSEDIQTAKKMDFKFGIMDPNGAAFNDSVILSRMPRFMSWLTQPKNVSDSVPVINQFSGQNYSVSVDDDLYNRYKRGLSGLLLNLITYEEFTEYLGTYPKVDAVLTSVGLDPGKSFKEQVNNCKSPLYKSFVEGIVAIEGLSDDSKISIIRNTFDEVDSSLAVDLANIQTFLEQLDGANEVSNKRTNVMIANSEGMSHYEVLTKFIGNGYDHKVLDQVLTTGMENRVLDAAQVYEHSVSKGMDGRLYVSFMARDNVFYNDQQFFKSDNPNKYVIWIPQFSFPIIDLTLDGITSPAYLNKIPVNGHAYEWNALLNLHQNYYGLVKERKFKLGDLAIDNPLNLNTSVGIAASLYSGSPDTKLVNFESISAEEMAKANPLLYTFGNFFEMIYNPFVGRIKQNLLTFVPTIEKFGNVAPAIALWIIPLGMAFILLLCIYIIYCLATFSLNQRNATLVELFLTFIVTILVGVFLVRGFSTAVDVLFSRVPSLLIQNELILQTLYELEGIGVKKSNTFFAGDGEVFSSKTQLIMDKVSDVEAKEYRSGSDRKEINSRFYLPQYDSSRQDIIAGIYLQNKDIKMNTIDLLQTNTILMSRDENNMIMLTHYPGGNSEIIGYYTPYFHITESIVHSINTFSKNTTNNYKLLNYNGQTKTTGRSHQYFNSIFFVAGEKIIPYIEEMDRHFERGGVTIGMLLTDQSGRTIREMMGSDATIVSQSATVQGVEEGNTGQETTTSEGSPPTTYSQLAQTYEYGLAAYEKARITAPDGTELSLDAELIKAYINMYTEFGGDFEDWLGLKRVLFLTAYTGPFTNEYKLETLNTYWYPHYIVDWTDEELMRKITNVNERTRTFVLRNIGTLSNITSDQSLIKVIALKATMEMNKEFSQSFFQKKYPRMISADIANNDFLTKMRYMPLKDVFTSNGEQISYYLVQKAGVLGPIVATVEIVLFIFRALVYNFSVIVAMGSVLALFVAYILRKKVWSRILLKLCMFSSGMAIILRLIEVLVYKLEVMYSNHIDVVFSVVLNLLLGIILVIPMHVVLKYMRDILSSMIAYGFTGTLPVDVVSGGIGSSGTNINESHYTNVSSQYSGGAYMPNTTNVTYMDENVFADEDTYSHMSDYSYGRRATDNRDIYEGTLEPNVNIPYGDESEIWESTRSDARTSDNNSSDDNDDNIIRTPLEF